MTDCAFDSDDMPIDNAAPARFSHEGAVGTSWRTKHENAGSIRCICNRFAVRLRRVSGAAFDYHTLDSRRFRYRR